MSRRQRQRTASSDQHWFWRPLILNFIVTFVIFLVVVGLLSGSIEPRNVLVALLFALVMTVFDAFRRKRSAA